MTDAEISPIHDPAALAALAARCNVYGPGPDDLSYALQERGEIIAFISWRPVCDQADLLALAVAENYRRRGLARRLLLETAPPALLTLEVAENNGPARRLYESLGFQPVGRRADYYGPGRPALVLQKDRRFSAN